MSHTSHFCGLDYIHDFVNTEMSVGGLIFVLIRHGHGMALSGAGVL